LVLLTATHFLSTTILLGVIPIGGANQCLRKRVQQLKKNVKIDVFLKCEEYVLFSICARHVMWEKYAIFDQYLYMLKVVQSLDVLLVTTEVNRK